MKKPQFYASLILMLIAIGFGSFLLFGAEPSWIQYNERVVGENHPTYTDVANRPTKELFALFTSQHTAEGVHKDGVIGATPVGTIWMFGGSTAPSGWLLCDGSEISRSTYSALFAVIGETYGAGDGSTTFVACDFRGRAAIGAGQGSGLTNRSLGDTPGEETHVLTTDELPNHGHSLTIYSSSGSSTTPRIATTVAGGTIVQSPISEWYTGGDTSHNTMQPSLVVNYMIKY